VTLVVEGERGNREIYRILDVRHTFLDLRPQMATYPKGPYFSEKTQLFILMMACVVAFGLLLRWSL
jgi:hypothetical protein